MRTNKFNYFKLAASHKRITGESLRIQGLQLLDKNGKIEIECSLAFRWNAENERFDLIQSAILQGKIAPVETVIAHFEVGQEVEFVLGAEGKSLKGLVRLLGQERTFSVGYTFGSKSVRLNALPPQKPVVRFVPTVVLYQK